MTQVEGERWTLGLLPPPPPQFLTNFMLFLHFMTSFHTPCSSIKNGLMNRSESCTSVLSYVWKEPYSFPDLLWGGGGGGGGGRELFVGKLCSLRTTF